MIYKCPLCGSALTKTHYHKVIKIQDEHIKGQKRELDQFRKQAEIARAAVAAAKNREREVRAKSKERIEAAKTEGARTEQKRYELRDKRLMARIKKLEEEKKMMQKHTTPQEIGLADETVLLKRLKKEFPDDEITNPGKGGDVLQCVKLNGTEVGCIIYECKHYDRIAANHIEQTAIAKKTRQANYAVLVTTGTRKGFSGLDKDSGIFIVSQAGAITLAIICRDSLITMAKLKLDEATKEAAAKKLMDYITSPNCKTPLEEAIIHTKRAHDNLIKEISRHFNDWRERHELYQSIHYDVAHIKTNIERVINGAEPLRLEKQKVVPLALPISVEGKD